MYHYCSGCGNVMQLYNNYGSKRLYCRYCKQEVIYGHANPEKDQNRHSYQEETQQEEEKVAVSAIECHRCEGVWKEKDLEVETITMYGMFLRCPNCMNRIFVRY